MTGPVGAAGFAATVVGFGALTVGCASSPKRDVVSHPPRKAPASSTTKAASAFLRAWDGARRITEEVTGINPFWRRQGMSEGPEISPREGRSKSDAPLAAGLYLVATPIGNARDLTLRAIDILKAADRLYAEDTRVTARLLAMHAIARPLHSYREHNAQAMDDRILRELEQGLSIALVSDAGTPLVSDPGQSLVERVAAAASSSLASCRRNPMSGAGRSANSRTSPRRLSSSRRPRALSRCSTI
jgi:hypothetical protein